MVVRVDGSPREIVPTLAAMARGEGAGLTPSVQTLADAFEDKLKEPRRVALIASTLGICALLLAVIGLAGMIAYTVSQRMKEIGLRVALGARPTHVVTAIVRQFRWPVIGGAMSGSLLAGGVGMVLSRELFGVSPFDLTAHGGALLVFALVTAIVAAPAVRRALRIDPAETLRSE